jgi:trk system potassium uptake protein TrkA
MKIVIIGAGEVGTYLSAILSEQGHDIVVVESSQTIAEQIDEAYNVRVIQGNGSSAEILAKADVGSCDFLLAMTNDDRSNIIAASLSKAMGAHTTIARYHDQTYTDTSFVNYQLHFGIDHLINPEGLCAVELAKTVRHPGRVAVENFARGEVEVQQVEVQKGSRLVHKKLKELKYPEARVGYIQRGEDTQVPTAETEIEVGDVVTLFGAPEQLFQLRRKCEADKKAKQIKIVLLGGSETSIALIRLLTNPRFKIRLIEKDLQKCRNLATKFPNITVIQGDGTSLRLMEEEQISNADYFLACTKDDESNIVTGLQASKLGVPHVGVVINKTDYNTVMDSLKSAIGVELIVSPRVVTANDVLRYLSRKPIVELSPLPQGSGSIYELVVKTGSPAAGKRIREISWPPHCVAVAIQHKYQAKVATAEEIILPGDRLLIITPPENLEKLTELLSHS